MLQFIEGDTGFMGALHHFRSGNSFNTHFAGENSSAGSINHDKSRPGPGTATHYRAAVYQTDRLKETSKWQLNYFAIMNWTANHKTVSSGIAAAALKGLSPFRSSSPNNHQNAPTAVVTGRSVRQS